jgi:microcystin-dependent protein
MNNIIDQTTMTGDAILGTTLEVADGKLKIRSQGITSNELASNAVKTIAIEDGAVTQAKAANMLIPAGAVMAFAMNAVPTGWLLCNGGFHSRTVYAALFVAIGTSYGSGDGSTTFTVPDLQGHFVRGFGTAAGSGAFGVKQDDDFKAHTHGFVSGRNYTVPTTTTGDGRARDSTQGKVDTVVTFDNGTGTETRPKNIAMLYCIKY